MAYTDNQLEALVARCEQFRTAVAPDGYRNSLALCITTQSSQRVLPTQALPRW